MSTVLIVEDDKDTDLLIALNLSKRGHETLEAHTVAEGLELFKTRRPQLLILDLKLPDASGWDMLAAIDRDPALPKIPVVTVTASVVDWSTAYPYPNIVGNIRKPFALAELLNMVTAGSGA